MLFRIFIFYGVIRKAVIEDDGCFLNEAFMK